MADPTGRDDPPSQTPASQTPPSQTPPPATPHVESDDIPQATVRPRRRGSMFVIWLVPIIALLFGAWAGISALRERGPTITISFKSGEGIEARKTRIKYKNVDIGEVRDVRLSEDHQRVVVAAQLSREAEDLLVDDTRFWVVRPRISGGSVTGLGTLLAGSHIGMDAGQSTTPARNFVGLEQPAVVTRDLQGRQFALQSEDLGSIDIGSPVYFRHIQVGQVVGYELEPDGKGVSIKAWVNAPYDKLVHTNTRFWFADGFDVTLDASGLKVETQSIVSILLGGIAFEGLPDAPTGAAAPANARFDVYNDRSRAMKASAMGSEVFELVFKESVRGLNVGAPVDFRGVVVGEVSAIDISFDRVAREITVPVRVRLFVDRLRGQRGREVNAAGVPFDSREFMDRLVARGFRAQLRTANLLTGQLYVGLDFQQGAPKRSIDWSHSPPELPTTRGSLQELQTTLASIATKIDKVPFDEIGERLSKTLENGNRLIEQLDKVTAPEARAMLSDARKTLQSADRLIEQLGTETAPEVKAALADVRKTLSSIDRTVASVGPGTPIQKDIRDALREVAKAAHSIRVLSDYLERHPESIIRGKKEDAK
jgi:paraquat-inducible protein B